MMKRRLDRIGKREPPVQTSAQSPPGIPQTACATCILNKKASIHSDGAIVVHCPDYGYVSGKMNCVSQLRSDKPPPELKCATCFWAKQIDTRGVECTRFTVQQIAYAYECDQYTNAEEQQLENEEHEALRLMHITVKNTSFWDRVWRGQRFDGVDFDLLPWWEQAYRRYISRRYGAYPRPTDRNVRIPRPSRSPPPSHDH